MASFKGRELRELRKAAGWTQAKVGKAVGTDKSNISLLENGFLPLTSNLALRVRRVLLRAIQRRAIQIDAINRNERLRSERAVEAIAGQ